MVDTVQNLTGTTASVVVPEASSAPKVSVGTGSETSAVELGNTAPATPVTEADAGSVSVDVKSAMGDVMQAMQNMPPPSDIESVQDCGPKSQIMSIRWITIKFLMRF